METVEITEMSAIQPAYTQCLHPETDYTQANPSIFTSEEHTFIHYEMYYTYALTYRRAFSYMAQSLRYFTIPSNEAYIIGCS
jgi:hypothetical protein